MSQAGIVTRLAVRELWISFRLLALLAAYVGVGAIIAILPAPTATTLVSLAVGLGAAVVIGCAIAADALSTERALGRAGWLVTRSISRATVLFGWYVALAGVTLLGLGAAGMLGWLAISSPIAPFDLSVYAAVITGVAALALAAIAIGLLLGTVLRRHVATAAAFVIGSIGIAAALVARAGLRGAAGRARRARHARTADRRRAPRRRDLPGRCGSDPGRGSHRPRPRRPVTAAGTEATVRMHPAAAWATLVVASLGVFLGGAELMVVAIALPSIVADFGGWADLARVSWIVNGYLLAYVVAMPLAGRGADLWGARRLYVVALVLFVVGSAGAGVARVAGPEDGLSWLIAARVVQGFGGGALVPLSMALASHLFTGRQRAAALGLEGAATYVGMAIGPAYGAWVLLSFSLPLPGLDVVSWQWIFLLNVPIGIVTLLLIYVVAGGVETPRVRAGLDLGGAALLTVALVAGIGAVTVSGANGWTDPLVIGGLLLSLVAFAAFVRLELRSSSPLVDLRLFADRAFSAANAVSLLTGYTLATAIIGGPVFVDRVLFGTDAQASTLLTALTLAIAIGALAGGLVSGFIGERIVTVAGVAVSAAGLWLALGWRDDTQLDRLVRDLAVFGVGFGLTVSPRATAAVEAAGAGAYGVASAMLQITRTIGMSLGLALLTSIGQNRIDELSALISDPVLRDELVVELGRPEFTGVDPAGVAGADRPARGLVAWPVGRGASPDRRHSAGRGACDPGAGLVRARPPGDGPGGDRLSQESLMGSATITSSPQLRL